MALITLYCAWCKKDSPPVSDSQTYAGLSVVDWFVDVREEMCQSCYEASLLGKRKDVTTHSKMLKYHMANPYVYDELVKASEALVSRPQNKGARLGIAMVFGFVRYEMRRGTYDAYNPDFKIGNNYQPHYARMILLNNPAWSDVFATRELFGREN